ncbi:hypothetical protein Zm00014a_040641 [Zea mays]|uniref:Uncharacterized protein n=1 Tax=Zea mays TaxID=4577 RepID=A0A3L6DTJ5_MAIZE|nr:hypothetical protein Zm00014a_040641 [Zea mays]
MLVKHYFHCRLYYLQNTI